MLGATTIWDTHTCLFSQKPANHLNPSSTRPFFMDKVAFLWILDHLQSTFSLKIPPVLIPASAIANIA